MSAVASDSRPPTEAHTANDTKLAGHLESDAPMGNLGHRAASGGVWVASAQLFGFVTNIGSAMIFARLLTPGDFGMIAMAAAMVPFLRIFREAGLSTATVQKENITHAQVSNLFWINLGLGTMVTLVGCALAPVLAWFFKDQRLIAVATWLSLTFLLSGSAVQHLALLNRQMRFAAIAGIDISAAALGLAGGLTLAWLGWGYWSLVGMQLTTTIVEVLLAWKFCDWRPQAFRRKSGTLPLLHFGASMTVFVLFQRLASIADVMLLGRFFGAAAVGLYSRAQLLVVRPFDQFVGPFDRVFIPILSRLQSQADRYRQVFLQAYNIIALFSFTFAGLLIGLSEPLVYVLLGRDWYEVIPIFTWSSLAALFIPMYYAGMWLLTTQGRKRDLVRLGVLVPSLTLLSVLAGVPYGPTGLALSFSLVGVFVRLPTQYLIAGRSGPVSARDLFGVFVQHIPLWATVAIAARLTHSALGDQPSLLQLIAGTTAGLTGAGIYIGLVPGRRQTALYILERLRHVIQKRRAPAV